MKVKVSESELHPLYVLTHVDPDDVGEEIIELPDKLVDKFRTSKLEFLQAQAEIRRFLNGVGYRTDRGGE